MKDGNPKFIHIAIGEHWVKCVQLFSNNYAILAFDGHTTNDPIDANCVVCSMPPATSTPCLHRET